jgi:hypothetical protein
VLESQKTLGLARRMRFHPPQQQQPHHHLVGADAPAIQMRSRQSCVSST